MLLVGGRSSRMGRDKALLSLAPGGPPLVALAAEKLGRVADEVLLVGPQRAGYASLGLPRVPDAFPGTGPLGGILSGLSAARNAHALVAACDMPFLSVRLLEYMAALPRNYDVLVPELEAGRLEPLHAIYSWECLQLIAESLRCGERKAAGWFGGADVQVLGREVLRYLDPELRSFINVNRPEEWEAARRMYGAIDTDGVGDG